MAAMIAIDNRCLRVVTHPAGAKQVGTNILILDRFSPDIAGPRGFHDFD